ncbi:MAG: FG-GAP-like repeat-containing protein [Acidobacteriia bacterium]|nr:FG-GAP-like repeat-containing protein [Terriglobia bacterium]
MRFFPQQNPTRTVFIFNVMISILFVAVGLQPFLLRASDRTGSLTTPSPLAACLSPGFGVQSVYPVDTSPTAVASGDFNGDGKVDLVVANKGSKSFSILLGNGDGTFQAAVTTPIPGLRNSGPLSVAAGDFDGDGKADIAFASGTSEKVSILLGNGNGTFTDAVISPMAPEGDSVATGEFNGDGKLDLAFVSHSNVALIFANGDRTFRTTSISPYGKSIVAGDFTGDGKLDLAISTYTSKVSILGGRGDGSFYTLPQFDFLVGGDPVALATGDFNGDGRLDIAVANYSTGTVSILLGGGSVIFQPVVSYPAGSKLKSVVAADFNGDGFLDLAVTDNNTNEALVLQGNGDGTFKAPTHFGVGVLPIGILAVDVNGDGKKDLVVTNSGSNTVSVLLNTCISSCGSITLSPDTIPSASQGVAYSQALSATGGTGPYTFSVVAGALPQGLVLSTSGVISGTPVVSGINFIFTIAVTDSNGCQASRAYQVDVAGVPFATSNAVANVTANSATFSGTVNPNRLDTTAYFQYGTTASYGSTTPSRSISGLSNSLYIAAELSSLMPNTLYHYRIVASNSSGITNGLDGTFTTLAGGCSMPAFVLKPSVTVESTNHNNSGSTIYAVAVGDLNGDGKADLAMAGIAGLAVSMGNGDGTFGPVTKYDAGTEPQSVSIGDLNGDGKLDVVVPTRDDVRVFLGNGDGTFQTGVSYSVRYGPFSVDLGDFNGDGKVDLAVASYRPAPTSSIVSILLGNGNGTFQTAVTYSVSGSGPIAVVARDFNRDGKLDLATVNEDSNDVSILLGNGDGTLRTDVPYAVGSYPLTLAAGDFDGDGKIDLAVVNSSDDTISILRGNGDGTFRAKVDYPVGQAPAGIAALDFNGDGRVDLAVLNYLLRTVSLLTGNGNGTFQSPIDYGITFTIPQSITAGDLDGDGKPDLAVAYSGAAILLNVRSSSCTVATKSLTVSSVNPDYGVTVTVTPIDNSGLGTGGTRFTRTYNPNTQVTLTAPATASGNNFQKWQRNGADYSTSATITFGMDADYTATAIYGSTGNDPGATSSLVLVGGSLAGQTLSPSNRTVTVAAGTSLSGQVTVQLNSAWPANTTMAMGVTPNWGTHSTSFVDPGGFTTPVSGLNRNIPVNLTAPSLPGTYYITTAFGGEASAAYLMSCTSGSNPNGPVWNNGDDVADWSAPTIATANANGTVQVNYLTAGGISQYYVPATAIIVIVQTQTNTSVSIPIQSGGSGTASTAGASGTVKAGYATVGSNSGPSPYGIAVFSFEQNNVVATEAGVPASPPTKRARIFIDYRTGVTAKTDHQEVGTISTNTGFAVVNQGTAQANITLTLRDRSGRTVAAGQGLLGHGVHRALFINELNQWAADFNLPSDFPSVTQFGSLDFESDQPLSIVALRLTTNQRGETLLTTTPVADLTQAPNYAPIYFPQFADGGGYRSSFFLLNTSGSVQTGTVKTFDNRGSELTTRSVAGSQAQSEFIYQIEPNGFYTLLTDGTPAGVNVGSVQVIPDSGSSTPVGAGVFSYSLSGGGPSGTSSVVSESGIPSAIPSTHARIFIDRSAGHNTGVAIAAVNASPVHLYLTAYQMDGTTAVGNGTTGLDLVGNGHDAKFISEFIPSFLDGFTGVLDLSSTSPFVALTLRSLTNARGDFLMTTFPIADYGQLAPSPVIFPQIVDGGGYKTQFILLGTSGSVNTTLSFFDDDGSPMGVGKLRR